MSLTPGSRHIGPPSAARLRSSSAPAAVHVSFEKSLAIRLKERMPLPEEFYARLERVERASFHYGNDTRPLRSELRKAFRDAKHQREFLKACHRGFEKAQRTVVEMLRSNSGDTLIDEDERERRELVLRKVIDGILFTMVGAQTWITRRVVLHDAPPKLEFKVIDRTMKTVDELNAKDRLTFAVAADLSTFVHVCDVVQVQPLEHKNLNFIELKEGRINKLLDEQLEGYAPVPESLEKVKSDPAIRPEHLPQAKRMLRQRIRLEQTIELITTDKGIDISTNRPLRMNHDIIHEETYRKPLIEACETALRDGLASFSVNYCLHIGVSNRGATAHERKQIAVQGALFGLAESMKAAKGGLAEQYTAIEHLRGEGINPVQIMDLVHSHLQAVPANSLFTWHLPYPVLWPIVRGDLSIVCAFDLAGFFFAAERAGMKASLSTRKNAERVFSMHGRSGAPNFGGRIVTLRHPDHNNDRMLLSGAFSRFVNNLHSPLSFLIGIKNQWAELTESEDKAT